MRIHSGYLIDRKSDLSRSTVYLYWHHMYSRLWIWNIAHASVCDVHVMFVCWRMASPYRLRAEALCTSWGARAAPGGQAVCSWRPEISASLMGSSYPWAPYISPKLAWRLCCSSLSDVSCAIICTYLNRPFPDVHQTIMGRFGYSTCDKLSAHSQSSYYIMLVISRRRMLFLCGGKIFIYLRYSKSFVYLKFSYKSMHEL